MKFFKNRAKKVLLLGASLVLCSVPFYNISNSDKNNVNASDQISNDDYLNIIENNSKEISEMVSKNKNLINSMDLNSQIQDFFNFENNNITLNSYNSYKNNYDKTVTNSDDKNLNNPKIKNFLKEKSLEYFDSFKNGKFTTKDMVKIANNSGYTCSNQSKDLNKILNTDKKEYNENSKKLNSFKTVFHSSVNQKGTEPNETISYILNNIKENGMKAGIFAGAAAALAAGYWAALWFFGLSISSAVAASTQAVLFSAEDAAYGGFYERYKNNPTYIEALGYKVIYAYSALSWTISAGSVPKAVLSFVSSIKDFINIVKGATLAIQIGISSTAWAAPTGLGFLILADLTITICNLVLNFPF
ncbi:MAG: hypothetical protein HDR31_01015 [Mycoplasma sp.]|nr:hypothetical protein [Mycoplasma sp.]